MTEPKFTPGPWWFHRDELLGAECKFIADVDQSYAESGTNWQEMEANAHLIAAAPEMYQALRVVLDAANDRLSDGLGHELPPIVRSMIERAIAKAEGGEA